MTRMSLQEFLFCVWTLSGGSYLTSTVVPLSRIISPLHCDPQPTDSSIFVSFNYHVSVSLLPPPWSLPSFPHLGPHWAPIVLWNGSVIIIVQDYELTEDRGSDCYPQISEPCPSAPEAPVRWMSEWSPTALTVLLSLWSSFLLSSKPWAGSLWAAMSGPKHCSLCWIQEPLGICTGDATVGLLLVSLLLGLTH